MCNTNNSTEAVRSAMWANDIVFCPQMDFVNGVLSSAAIVDKMIGALFPECMRDILLKRYERMAANSQKNATTVSDWSQNRVFCSIADVNKYKDMLLEVKQELFSGHREDELAGRWRDILDYPCVGHDLPVWLFRRDIGNPPRVMILSQDPLRKGHGRGNLTISSPWALHSPLYRKKTKNDLVFNVIEILLERGVALYLTDYKKIFLPSQQCTQCCKGCIGKRSGNTPTPRRVYLAFSKIYAELVREECRLFHPDLIVAFGCKAAAMFRKLDRISEFKSVRHLPRIHPGRWRFLSKTESDNLLRKENVQTKTDYYVESIMRELDNVRLRNSNASR